MPINKSLTTLASIIMIMGIIYLGVLSWNAVKTHDYIGISEQQRHSIMVTGEGEVTGVPDIATVRIGHSVEKKTVADAQKENTEKMNALIEKLKKDFKIDEKDIKTTGYNIYPQYDWNDGRSNLRGYQVTQEVVVKIRELDKVSQVLDAAGSAGLNQVGGLSFEIDDPESLRQEAREKALIAAKEKAEALADVAGVKLGRIISFSESSNQPSPIYYTKSMDASEEAGRGGAAPQIEAGSTEIVIIATVEYEIL